MIERERFFFLLLLGGAEALHLLGQRGHFLVQFVDARLGGGDSGLLLLHQPGQLAQFALERQRTSAGLLPAGDRVAVITDAIGQQEIGIGPGGGEALRGFTILRPASNSPGAR